MPVIALLLACTGGDAPRSAPAPGTADGGVWIARGGRLEPVAPTTGTPPDVPSPSLLEPRVYVTDAEGGLGWVGRPWVDEPTSWWFVEPTPGHAAPTLAVVPQAALASLPRAAGREASVPIGVRLLAERHEGELVIRPDGRVVVRPVGGLPEASGWVTGAGTGWTAVLRGRHRDVVLVGSPGPQGWEVEVPLPDVAAVQRQLETTCPLDARSTQPLTAEGETWQLVVQGRRASLIRPDGHGLHVGRQGFEGDALSFDAEGITVMVPGVPAPDPREIGLGARRPFVAALTRLAGPVPCRLARRGDVVPCELGAPTWEVTLGDGCERLRFPDGRDTAAYAPASAERGTLSVSSDSWVFEAEQGGAALRFPREALPADTPRQMRLPAWLLRRADDQPGWVAVPEAGALRVLPLADHPRPSHALITAAQLERGEWVRDLSGQVELGVEAVAATVDGAVEIDLPLRSSSVTSGPSGEPVLELVGARASVRLHGHSDGDGLRYTPSPAWFDTRETLARHLDTACGAPPTVVFSIRGRPELLVFRPGGVFLGDDAGEVPASGQGSTSIRAGLRDRQRWSWMDGREIEVAVPPRWQTVPSWEVPEGGGPDGSGSRPALDPGVALWMLARQQPVPCAFDGQPCWLEPGLWNAAGCR